MRGYVRPLCVRYAFSQMRPRRILCPVSGLVWLISAFLGLVAFWYECTAKLSFIRRKHLIYEWDHEMSLIFIHFIGLLLDSRSFASNSFLRHWGRPNAFLRQSEGRANTPLVQISFAHFQLEHSASNYAISFYIFIDVKLLSSPFLITGVGRGGSHLFLHVERRAGSVDSLPKAGRPQIQQRRRRLPALPRRHRHDRIRLHHRHHGQEVRRDGILMIL